MHPMSPAQVAKNFKPKFAEPPRQTKQTPAPTTKKSNVERVRQWTRKDSYFIEIGDVIRLKQDGPLFLVKVADPSPISAEKVIHCVPTLNDKAKPTIFYTGATKEQAKYVWVYEEADKVSGTPTAR